MYIHFEQKLLHASLHKMICLVCLFNKWTMQPPKQLKEGNEKKIEKNKQSEFTGKKVNAGQETY